VNERAGIGVKDVMKMGNRWKLGKKPGDGLKDLRDKKVCVLKVKNKSGGSESFTVAT